MYPFPPNSCTASIATSVAARDEYSFIADASDRLTGFPACVRSIALKTMLRTFTRAISISASLSWINWNCAISLPHSFRDFAYSVHSFRHCSMMPRAR